ncbi:unnamed protein product [Polarella glacialis]|uniref:Mur ligase central domain-containing protein n=1 Tax=Polarella glacialis TaxID=89957 RepID=A0A813JJC4_POLGL|nr:unnamed protein product [Polarella glacialis]
MVFAALKEAGLSVGSFNSPHLEEPLDAVRLASSGCDVPVDPKVWAGLEDEVLRACKLDLPSSDEQIALTSFELQVVTVLLLFARQRVDVAVLEVGLGGRADATNVLVHPAACGITGIAMDHQNVLGTSAEEIAHHKAGIFKQGSPALISTARMSESVRAVIAECAHQAGASPVRWVEEAHAIPESSLGRAGQSMRIDGLTGDLFVPLLGDFQRSNAALALAMLQELRAKGPPLQSASGKFLDESVLDDATIAAGFAATCWRGRLDWCELPGVGSVLVDGAHNVEAAEALGQYVDEAIRHQGPSQRAVTWVIGMSAGKDSAGVLQQLLHDEDSVLAVTFGEVAGMPWVRCQPAADLAAVARSVRPGLRRSEGSFANLLAALQAAHSDAPASQVVVCGSLYLVADFMRLLRSKVGGTT